MINRLEYSSELEPVQFNACARATGLASLIGIIAVVTAGALSTAAMERFRAAEGMPVLTGLPREKLYHAWIEGIPMALATTALLATWILSVWRRPRRDRLTVAAIAFVPLAGLWCVAMCWIVSNSFLAFP